MVAPAESSKVTQNNNSLSLDDQTAEKQPQQSQVGGLEEDDEFEEFAVQGNTSEFYVFRMLTRRNETKFIHHMHL